MNKKVTIIIATYNSKKLLEKVFKSIELQTYPKELIRVIAVDGGSLDLTKEFVVSEGFEVIENPKTEPVYAKFLGFKEATSDYVIYLDHDEVLENKNSIKNKVEIIESNKTVKAVLTSGYKSPPNISFINDYINDFGDPFSAFRYWLSKQDLFFINRMKAKYTLIKEDEKSVIFDFSNRSSLPIIELVAAGSMIDAAYLKQIFPETLERPELLPHLFYMLLSKDNNIAIAKDDAIFHYSSDTFWKYLNKIKWRIKNNIFFPEMAGAGFKGREQYENGFMKYKKYFFIPYAFSMVFPLIDSLYLIITRKKLSYFIHLPLTVYTAVCIVGYGLVKIFGYRPHMKSYDEKSVINRDEI